MKVLKGKCRRIFSLSFLRRSSTELQYIAILLITIAGGFLRAGYIDFPIRYDEAYTYLAYGSRPVLEIIGNYSFPNNHIFHSLLVKYSLHCFGNHIFSLRLPTLSAGILMIPISYIVLKIRGYRYAGLLAGTFIATDPLLIEYSTNARGYLISADLFLLSLLFSPFQKTAHSLTKKVLYVMATALSIFTIPISIYAVGVSISMLFFGPSTSPRQISIRNRLSEIGETGFWIAVVAGIAYLPAAYFSGVYKLVSPGVAEPLSVIQAFSSLKLSLIELWNSSIWHLPKLIVGIYIIGLISIYSISSQSRAYRRLTVWTATALLGLILLTGFSSASRFYIFLVPLLLLGIAAGLQLVVCKFVAEERNRSIPVLLLTITTMIFAALRTEDGFLFPPLRESALVAEQISKRISALDNVLAPGVSLVPLAYQLEQHLVSRTVIIGIYNDEFESINRDIHDLRHGLFVVIDKANLMPSGENIYEKKFGLNFQTFRVIYETPYTKMYYKPAVALQSPIDPLGIG